MTYHQIVACPKDFMIHCFSFCVGCDPASGCLACCSWGFGFGLVVCNTQVSAYKISLSAVLNKYA